MGNDEFKWSKREREIVRKLFDTAYQKEISKIKDEIVKILSRCNEPKDIWKLHDYLSEKRKETDLKFDYRYSVMIRVFVCY